MEYIVSKGDNLTKIAKKFNTTIEDIVINNNITNPNFIRIGQKLKISNPPPANEIWESNGIKQDDKILKKIQFGYLVQRPDGSKYTYYPYDEMPEIIGKPSFKLEQIPTKNKIHIINDFDNIYNYIVEDDKIYYSRKGKDNWIDISENIQARKNLFNFLNNKYNFKGYDDREKEIYNLIQQDKYDFNTYGKETLKPTQVKKPLPKKQVNSTKPSKQSNWFINSIIGAAIAENPHIMMSSGWVQDKNGDWTVRPQTRKSSKKEPSFLESLKVKNPGDIGAIWNKILEGDFSTAFNIAYNGVQRAYEKKVGNDPISNFQIPGQADTSTKYAIRPGTFTGDTIKTFNQRISPQQYIIPESIDVNEYTFGYRNRGNYNPINTEAAAITAFGNFKPFGKHDTGFKTYIGIDKNGNLKVGDISQFSKGDYLSGTYSNEIASFMKDNKGNIVMTKSLKNPLQNQPAYIIWDNGKLVKKPTGQAINILVRKDDPVGNQYGNVTGGRVLVRVGNEFRLLSGSVKDIDKQFEEMKKRNKVDHGTFYTLDNGSFNRGFRTYNRVLTSKDLRKYDELNSSGGNFLYLKRKKTPIQAFRSDTIWTPNVRTVNDESYKKGHSLQNEQKGIVLHHTAFMDDNLQGVVNHLTRKGGESAHVIIGFDGTRKVLARPNQVTFHAGQSIWNKRDNVNDFMIGIEFQGDTNKKDLTQKQIDSAVEYMAPIIRQNNIRLEDIVTHQQVRDMYNDYAKKTGGKTAPSKPDINYDNYVRIIETLKKKVYYEK